MASKFNFMPVGAHHLQEIHRAVQRRFPSLCDNTVLCKQTCTEGTEGPEWQHRVRASLQALKSSSGPVVKSERHGYWIFTLGQTSYPGEVEAAAIDVEDQDLTNDEIDGALRANRLRIGMVQTASKQALTRQRKGQNRIRTLTMEYYETCCAVCDINDPLMLVASHIVGWAEDAEHRGNLSNVICLCRIHDALFETGYWSLKDDLELLKKESVKSETIRQLLDAMISFSAPADYPPAVSFVRRHRKKAGFA
jgi:hypothetical protein